MIANTITLTIALFAQYQSIHTKLFGNMSCNHEYNIRAPFHGPEIARNPLNVQSRISMENDIYSLNIDEIYEEIIGKKISPNFENGNISFDYLEEFFSNGRWAGVQKMRGPVQSEGTWRISNGRICVNIIRSGSICRKVWRSRSSQKLYMENFFDASKDRKLYKIDIN